MPYTPTTQAQKRKLRSMKLKASLRIYTTDADEAAIGARRLREHAARENRRKPARTRPYNKHTCSKSLSGRSHAYNMFERYINIETLERCVHIILQADVKLSEVVQTLPRLPSDATRPSCMGALGYTLKAEGLFGEETSAEDQEPTDCRAASSSSMSHDAPSCKISVEDVKQLRILILADKYLCVRSRVHGRHYVGDVRSVTHAQASLSTCVFVCYTN